VDDAVTSPELILVSPPEVAAAARRALPDPGQLFAVVAPVPRAATRHEARRDTRFSRGSVAFTTLLALNCLLPFLLLIAARR
jgi:hypothetical protein